MLVDVNWLAANSADTHVLDARSPMRYVQGHIAHAISLPPLALTHVRPDRVRVLAEAEQLEKVIQAAGINPTMHVVVYGERGSQDAAFLYWGLHLCGVKNLSLLDGGIEAWRRAGFPLTREVISPQPSEFQIQLDSACSVSGDWLLASLGNSSIQVVDNRTLPEFTGEDALSQRGGRIPRAIHFEWSEALNPDLTFKPVEELKNLLAAAGVQRQTTIVNYCHAGARSAHATFVMKLAGFGDVRNYEAGWFEWGNNNKFPVETGALSNKTKVNLGQSDHNKNEIDLRGELCPYTLIYTKKKIDELEPGAALLVLIDNEDATQTIPAWAEQAGHKLLELKPYTNGWRIMLQKKVE